MADGGLSLVTPPPTDLSVEILNHIFGVGWDSLYQNGGASNTTATVLASMFHAFNIIILTGLVLYLLYVFTIGVVGTSTEGTPLGKRYHSVYAPFRAASSTALLAPLPWLKGFSIIQALILFGMSLSIGAADTLWSTAVDQLVAHPGKIAAEQLSDARPLAAKILETQVLHYYLQEQQGYDIASPKWEHHQVKHDGTNMTSYGYKGATPTVKTGGYTTEQYRLIFPMANGSGVNPLDLGYVTVGCSTNSTLMTNTCKMQQQAVNSMRSALAPAAKQIASDSGKTPNLATNAVSQAVQNYKNVMGGYADQIIYQTNQRLVKKLDEYAEMAKKRGWITAGSWYWHTANMQANLANTINVTPGYTPPDQHLLDSLTGDDFSAYTRAAAEYAYSASMASDPMQGVQSGNGALGIVAQFFAKPFRNALGYLTDFATDTSITGTAKFGHLILDANAVAMSAYAVYMGSTGAAGNVLSSIPFVGSVVKAVANVVDGNAFIQWLVPATWAFFLTFFATGMVMAYYIPAIPYILFTLATIGTFIIFLEAFVAGPLWAFSHGMVEGEGWAGTSARQGYMLYFTILLRPSLMIFGIFMSFALLGAANILIGHSFMVFFLSLTQGSFFIYGLMAGVILLTALLTLVYHKVFSLITLLPENVPAWVGQLTHKLGESASSAHPGVVMAGAAAVGTHAARTRQTGSRLQHAANYNQGIENGQATRGPHLPPGGGGGTQGGGDEFEGQANSGDHPGTAERMTDFDPDASPTTEADENNPANIQSRMEMAAREASIPEESGPPPEENEAEALYSAGHIFPEEPEEPNQYTQGGTATPTQPNQPTSPYAQNPQSGPNATPPGGNNPTVPNQQDPNVQGRFDDEAYMASLEADIESHFAEMSEPDPGEEY